MSSRALASKLASRVNGCDSAASHCCTKDQQVDFSRKPLRDDRGSEQQQSGGHGASLCGAEGCCVLTDTPGTGEEPPVCQQGD